MPIKNIIFDLGGVLINIDYHKTLDAFRQLGAINIDEVYSQSKQDALFDLFDVAKTPKEEFRSKLKFKLDIDVTDAEFDNAWNAMLLDIPIERLNFVKSLRASFRTFLFSNTNDIHLPEVFNICQREHGFDNFDEYFERQYYSNIFGQRKPNKEAFLAILSENGLEADETLFIDDTMQHVLGAREAGLHAIHLTPDKSLTCILDYINSLPKDNELEPGQVKSLAI